MTKHFKRLLVWAFALDQPVGASVRNLLAIRVTVSYALWVIRFKQLKALIRFGLGL